MTLGTCAPIVGAEVMCFSDERELLRAWKNFLLATDPDWLIGECSCARLPRPCS